MVFKGSASQSRQRQAPELSPDIRKQLGASQSVLIVVVPRDRFSTFPRCLEALYAHTSVPFHVLVVSGDTDAATTSYLLNMRREQPNLQLLLADRALTQAEARNLGLRDAGDRFCVILENDTIVHQGWLAPMLRCMRDHDAAVVAPLILWYRGIHAAGCSFQEEDHDGSTVLRHQILYTDFRQRPIDYPESHCVLLDRSLLAGIELFEEVEPFDVDLGLTLRKHGLRTFLEPRAIVTYAQPPPWTVDDVPLFRRRWDPASWLARNRRFIQKWGFHYDPSRKRASYRRQQLRLGLARWYPTRLTVGFANAAVGLERRARSKPVRFEAT